jgi:BirA family biotin operon repressor/biotin-[acetyl-CoA-carboxylase] ligase
MAVKHTRWLGHAWRHLDSCASTNDEAAAWARAGAPAGAVVVAAQQTRGRGRLGRRWHSPAGDNLYFSVVLRPPLRAHQVPPLSLAAGVAVAETSAEFAVAPALKWPNDVQVGDGKKVAGILAEMSSDGERVQHVVLGIGVNLNGTSFPDEIAATATSLALARGGQPVALDAFAAALCARLENWHDCLVASGPATIVKAWKRFAHFFGRRLTVSAGTDTFTAVAEDLDDEGALLLLRDDGSRTRVIAGEIT